MSAMHHRNVVVRTVSRNIYTVGWLVIMAAVVLFIYLYQCIGG